MSVSKSASHRIGLVKLLGWIRQVRGLPVRLVQWLFRPITVVCLQNKRFRRCAAFVRLHRRSLTAGFILLAHTLGILSSLNVLTEPRTPQGAIAWIISLNTFPYVTVPAYWTMGETDYDEYAIALRTRQARGSAILETFNDNLAAADLKATADTETKFVSQRLVNLPLTRGNHVELLIDGVETFESMFDSIRSAQAYVLVQFYILRDDRLGRRLQRLLIDKAQRGVRVLVLYDEFGSQDLPNQYLKEMKEVGIEVFGFNPPMEDVSPTRLNFRNHRKIVVVDGREAFVGGHNVGDEYYYGNDELGAYRDTHLKIRGPLVQTCQMVFVEDWYAVADELLEGLLWQPRQAAEQDMVALCLPSGPADTLETASLYFLQAINSAKQRIWIASPYFVPDQQMVTALQLAALRGVDVRVLVPAKSDSTLVWLSSYSYLPELEDVGIRTFRYQGRFMHQKVVLVDDDFSMVGTANFDNRSFRLNFEVMVSVFDRGFTAQIAAMLQEDFEHSQLTPATEFTDASYGFRILVQAARLLAPIQ